MWYRALRDLGVPCEMFIYPEDAHPLAGVECEADVIVQVMSWFAEHGVRSSHT